MMNKKKMTGSALAALLLAGTTSFTALAAIPNFTAVIGEKAYDLNYLSAHEKDLTAEIQAHLVAGKEIFVKDFSGNWVKNSDSAKLTVEEIAKLPAVAYTDEKGAKSEFKAGDDAVAPAGKFEVVSVSAISNTKVKVSLKEAVTSVDVKNFAIEDMDKKALEVKEAKLTSDGKAVIVTTAVQTAYKPYTITVNGFKGNFVGLPVDTTKPTVEVLADTFKSVKILFSEVVDSETAENIANYTIDNGLTVLKAELSKDGKTVTLTTAEQKVGLIYNVTVKNVADFSGNKMDDKSGLCFGGQTKDTSALTLKDGGIVPVDYNEVTIEFAKEVDDTTAQNIANYTINNGLTVLKAELQDDGKTVKLTTAEQKVGTMYTLTVNNVIDKLGNKMKEAASGYFGAMAKDLSKPVVKSLVPANNDTVTITFGIKVSKETAENIANYAIDKDLAVLKAELQDNQKDVKLTTAPQKIGSIYTLTVDNVISAYGTKMDKTSNLAFAGSAKDTQAPTISNVTAEKERVTIVFNKEVDKVTALNPTNYAFDGELGYPTKAEFAKDRKDTVILTTAPQKSGKVYYVTVNNVVDVYGNVISSKDATNKKSFLGKAEDVKSEVKLNGVSIVNVNTIDLLFDSEISKEEAAKLNVTIDKVTAITNPGLAYNAIVNKDNKNIVRLQFTATDKTKLDFFKSGTLYTVTVKGITNLVEDGKANVKAFAGTNVNNQAPEIKAVATIDNQTVKVIFSKEVKITSANPFYINSKDNSYKLSAELNTPVTETLVYLNDANRIEQSKVYTLTCKDAAITDAAGYVNAIVKDSSNKSLEYKFAGTNVENEAPKVQAAVVKDMYNFEIIFSEDITGDVPGFTVKIGDTTLPADAMTASIDGNKILVALKQGKAKLEAGKIYEVKLNDANTIKDLSGKAMEVKDAKLVAGSTKFAGTNVENAKPEIVGVSVNDARTEIKVTFNENVTAIASDKLLVVITDKTNKDVSKTGTIKDNVVTITTDALTPDSIYSIKATGDVLDLNAQAAKDTAVQFGTKPMAQ